MSCSPEERAISAMLLTGGAIPWLGYAWLGHWDDRELALATLVLIFTARAIYGCVRTTRSHPR